MDNSLTRPLVYNDDDGDDDDDDDDAVATTFGEEFIQQKYPTTELEIIFTEEEYSFIILNYSCQLYKPPKTK